MVLVALCLVVSSLVSALGLDLVVLQEWGSQLQPSLLLKQLPKPSSGPPPGWVPASLASELALPSRGLESVLVVLVFLDSELGPYLEPWPPLKQPNTEQQGLELLADSGPLEE